LEEPIKAFSTLSALPQLTSKWHFFFVLHEFALAQREDNSTHQMILTWKYHL